MPHGSDLRCLLVTESLDASGMDEFVAFLARRLRAAGVTVAVLLASIDRTKGIGAIGRRLITEGIDVVDVDEMEGPTWIRRWAPDVVNVHGAARWPLAVAREISAGAVVTLHGMHDLLGRPAEELARERGDVDGFIAVSEGVREHYLACDPSFPADRVVTIPNPVDPARVRPYDRERVRHAVGLDDGDFLFLSLARHALQKNNYGLVAAFAEAAADLPRARLLICGRVDDPAYTAQVVSLRDRSATGSRIHLRGNLDAADALLWAADAFVLDSFFEGWALGSMEALGTGLPVLLSDVGGAREQVEGGPRRGMIVPNPIGPPATITWDAISRERFREQANRRALVDGIRSLAGRQVRFESRESIAEFALERYSAAECAHRHMAVLEYCAEHGTLAPADSALAHGTGE